MTAVSGASVLGASLGASGVRSVISDSNHAPVLEVHEPVASRPAPNGLAPDPWDAVITSMHDLAHEYASADFYPVLALRESDPETAYEQDVSDGVVLVSELGAQLEALRETGVLAGERCVALFDVGASGTSISVVDVDSGRVLASRRTEELSGAGCDRMLCEHLIATFGAAEALTVEARRRLVYDVCAGKHELSLLRSVSVPGPFVGGRATLWRGNLDELVGDAVYGAVSMAVEVLDAVRGQGVRVDAIVAVGGGANMQIVRQRLFDAVSMPVYVPEKPELLAARGAARIARTAGVRPPPAMDDAPTEQFTAVGTDSAELVLAGAAPVGAVVSKLPRHSGTSARRGSKSRHLGGALAALVAVCVVGTVAAAAARTGDEQPEPSVFSPQDSSSTARYESVMPAAGGAPADLEPSSEPGPPVTASTSLPVDADAAASLPSEASTVSSTASSTASSTVPRPTSPRMSSPSIGEDSRNGDRSSVKPPTVATTTAPPTTTTHAPPTTTSTPPSSTQPSSTKPSSTKPSTASSPTTTRPTRTFNFPMPKFDLPRG